MQYPTKNAMMLRVSSSNDNYSQEQVLQKMSQLRTKYPRKGNNSPNDPIHHENESPNPPSANEVLGWEAKTPFLHGLAKVIAWHLDHHRPYQYRYPLPIEANPSSDKKMKSTSSLVLESGNKFLNRIKLPLCDIDDDICLRGKTVFPCVSECSDPLQCRPQTSLDGAITKIIQQVTEKCHIVVYTTVFHYKKGKERLSSQFPQIRSDNDDEENLDPRTLCYIAFISTEVRDKLELQEDEGVSHSPNDKNNFKSELVFQYNEWSIITLPLTDSSLSIGDELLFKLSPQRLFSPNVQYCVYIALDKGKRVPRFEDIYFLVDRMVQSGSPAKVLRKPTGHGFQIAVDYPPTPDLKSILLTNSILTDDPDFLQSRKMSLNDAIELMKELYKFDPDIINEVPLHQKNIMTQKTFYQYYISKMIRNDFRSNLEPKNYGFELKYFISGLGIVHDLRREEARQFRCEWYEEQLQYNNKLDQLSFAMVMARKELRRKILRDEPDRAEIERAEKHYTILDEVRAKTSQDLSEWVALSGKYETAHYKNNIIPFLNDEIKYDLPSTHIRVTNYKSMSKDRAKWTALRMQWKQREKEKRKS